MAPPDASASTPCFRFKGSSVPLTELELLNNQPDQLQQQLAAHTRAMPQLFQQLPMVLNLTRLPASQPLPDLAALTALCRSLGINPIGVRGDERLSAADCKTAGLAHFGAGRPAPEPAEERTPTAAQEDTPPPDAGTEASAPPSARLITTPVRSGQQLYARGGDLIILASVGAGAEVMADGNIHVYGALRGRALAGVCGNEQARVFCQSLEAELISIAGFFKACDDLDPGLWKAPAQAYLTGTRLETALLK